ncbi:hypothetical protein BJX76DRAFT_48927 [Aspergillus varians]
MYPLMTKISGDSTPGSSGQVCCSIIKFDTRPWLYLFSLAVAPPPPIYISDAEIDPHGPGQCPMGRNISAFHLTRLTQIDCCGRNGGLIIFCLLFLQNLSKSKAQYSSTSITEAVLGKIIILFLAPLPDTFIMSRNHGNGAEADHCRMMIYFHCDPALAPSPFLGTRLTCHLFPSNAKLPK